MALTIHVPRPDSFIQPVQASQSSQRSRDGTASGKPGTQQVAVPWYQFFTLIAKRLSGVANVVAVAAPDAAVAPAAYNQAHIQTIVTELNDVKARLNEALAALKV